MASERDNTATAVLEHPAPRRASATPARPAAHALGQLGLHPDPPLILP